MLQASPVAVSDKLRGWHDRARAKWAARPAPEADDLWWFGVHDEDRLLVAFGCTIMADDSVMVLSAVHEPSALGKLMFPLSMVLLRGVAAKRHVQFYVAKHNTRMIQLARLVGAKPVADAEGDELWELNDTA